VERYRQVKAPDSSTRPIWKSYQQSYPVAKQEELAKEIMTLAIRSIFFHTSKGSLTFRKILRHGTDGFNSLPKEGVLLIFIALKNSSASTIFEPANLGYNGKHAALNISVL
jgi:hypothetical protein